MVSTKKPFHPLGENTKDNHAFFIHNQTLHLQGPAFMNILNYKLDTTNELLTARIGLLATAHTINALDLSNIIDQHFPILGSNRALQASTFINTLLLSQHEGGECLDDTTHIAKDKALRFAAPPLDWTLTHILLVIFFVSIIFFLGVGAKSQLGTCSKP